MSKTHFLTPSWTSGATATSNGSAIADTAADRLLQVDPSRKFVSASSTNIRLTFDAGVAKPFDHVFIGAHNGIAADQVTITAHASTGALFTTPSFSYGPVSAVFAGDLSPFVERDIMINVGANPEFRYLGIEIDAPSNPDGYFQAGVVIVGEEFEPGIGPDLGWKTGWADPTEIMRSLNGIAIARAKRKYKVWNGTFPKQTFLDAVRFMAINLVYGNSIPCVRWWEPPVAGYQQYFIDYCLLKWPDGGAFEYANKAGLFDVGLETEGV